MSKIDETEARWRALIVVTVTLSYPLAQTGFDLGAYRELLFKNKLVAWTAVTATMMAFTIVPKQLLPMPRWHIWILTIPSIWLLGRFALGVSNPGAQIHPIIFTAGILSFVACFPYAIYLIVRMANPELADIRGIRSWSIVMSIAGIVFLTGYLIGTWNQYFIACQDARIAGSELPLHCIENTGGRSPETSR